MKPTLEGFTDQFIVVGEMCSAVNTGVGSVAVRQIFSEGLRHFLLLRLLARLRVLGGAHARLVLGHWDRTPPLWLTRKSYSRPQGAQERAQGSFTGGGLYLAGCYYSASRHHSLLRWTRETREKNSWRSDYKACALSGTAVAALMETCQHRIFFSFLISFSTLTLL